MNPPLMNDDISFSKISVSWSGHSELSKYRWIMIFIAWPGKQNLVSIEVKLFVYSVSSSSYFNVENPALA